MIIHTTGHTKNYPCNSPIAFDTKDVLYLHGYDKDGERCIVYLRHDITEGSEGSELTYPLWIGLNMSVKEMMEKLKGNEE